MRNSFINKIIEYSGSRDDIFIISGDAGLGVFDEFKENHPDKFLNLGVAEQNATSFAAGMSIAGFKVYVYNIIPFLLYRPYEQVRNDICYQELPVSLVGIGSGLTYAPQGMTHYSVEDIALARTLPNLNIISPIDPIEAIKAAEYTLSSENPTYIRMAKRGEPNLHKDTYFDITKPSVLKDGEKIGIIFHGSIGTEVIGAWEELSSEGIFIKLISNPMLNPLNEDLLLELLKGLKHVLCVEEHYITGGLSTILSEIYFRRKPSWNLIPLGVSHKFIHEIKDNSGMREYFGISRTAIKNKIKNILKDGK